MDQKRAQPGQEQRGQDHERQNRGQYQQPSLRRMPCEGVPHVGRKVSPAREIPFLDFRIHIYRCKNCLRFSQAGFDTSM
jgi:hypothetical protein